MGWLICGVFSARVGEVRQQTIDGRLDEPSWQLALRSLRFVDLISGRRPIHDARAAVLWDDAYLCVGLPFMWTAP